MALTDDCPACEHITDRYSSAQLDALRVAVSLDRFPLELANGTLEKLQLCGGHGVTKDTATSLVRMGAARWHRTESGPRWAVLLHGTAEGHALHITLDDPDIHHTD